MNGMMDFLPKEPYKKVFVVVFYATLGCILFYLFFRFFWMPLLPFMLALLLAAMISPVAHFLERKFRVPLRVGTLTLLVMLVGLLLFLMYSITMRLLAEAGDFLAKEMPQDGTGGFAKILQDKLATHFPSAKKYLESGGFSSAVRSALRSAAATFTSAIPGFLSGVIARLPLAMFFITVLIVASYYLVTDRARIFAGISRVVPEKIHKEIVYLRRRAGDSLLEYLKAAFILLLITFLELFLGFSLLSIPYSLTLAAIVALVDFFPILGTGTVMVPWAIVSFLSGDVKIAIGLLVLWAVITTVRQVVEPRIIGKKLGLHPFHALVAMYFGFSLFGLTGLILAPLAVTVLLGVIREKKQGNDKSKS